MRQKLLRATADNRDIEDRLERTLEENTRLKRELKEKNEKLTRVQTQFQRLAADWKRSVAETPKPRSSIPSRVLQPITPNACRRASTLSHAQDPPPATQLPSIARPATADGRLRADIAPPSSPSKGPMEELLACRAALRQANEEIERLHALVERATAPTSAPTPTDANAALQQQLLECVRQRQEIFTLQQQLMHAQAAIRTTEELQHQTHTREIAHLTQQLQASEAARQDSEQLLRQALDRVSREKDALSLRLKLLAEHEKEAEAKKAQDSDPMGLLQLQADVRDKSNQIAVLTSRLQYTQGQIETLNAECARLVEQLKHFHTNLAESKKEVLRVEYEKSGLQAKCARLEEVELTLTRRNEEVLQLEQELLKLTDALRGFNAETEQAVRRELNARIADLEAMRDQADAGRREKERMLRACQHDLADANRAQASLQADLAMYRSRLEAVQKEATELASRAAFSSYTTKELNEEEIHRALAVAAMRKRRGEATTNPPPPSGAPVSDVEAAETLELYDALNWDETWEHGQLREALATAALDLELAETRCQQMAEQAARHRAQLDRLACERDALLEENLELRRRVSHVQTVFAKQQLQAYRAAVAKPDAGDPAEAKNGLIQFCIRALEAEEGLPRALGVRTIRDPVSVFFTLDGLEGYDTMLSPTLHALEEPMDVRFVYKGLGKDEITLAQIQHTLFTLQLHQVTEFGSRIVAMHEIPGIALLTARELSIEERFDLIDGTGEKVGWVLMEMCCSQLMLPVLLGQPLTAGALLSAAEMRAALIALRSLLFLRVHVFKAEGLASVEGGTMPQPYVFYTAHSPHGGLGFVRDTVVRTAGNAFTTDPVFDAIPVDHRVVVDRELIHYIAHGSIVFVVFDERAHDVRENLGVVEVSLHPLLASPTAFIRETVPLHPQGTLSFGISWITGP
ncbi:unnamed protein product [Phytomonas sp. EM1]|nr:unnamed protein product [Phytomonas sp. EM1]|eukprot:CCW59562.1 unnamed protein product [Phytomonas sp. isolate EM1]